MVEVWSMVWLGNSWLVRSTPVDQLVINKVPTSIGKLEVDREKRLARIRWALKTIGSSNWPLTKVEYNKMINWNLLGRYGWPLMKELSITNLVVMNESIASITKMWWKPRICVKIKREWESFSMKISSSPW